MNYLVNNLLEKLLREAKGTHTQNLPSFFTAMAMASSFSRRVSALVRTQTTSVPTRSSSVRCFSAGMDPLPPSLPLPVSV